MLYSHSREREEDSQVSRVASTNFKLQGGGSPSKVAPSSKGVLPAWEFVPHELQERRASKFVPSFKIRAHT